MHRRACLAIAVLTSLAIAPATASAALRTVSVDSAGPPASWSGVATPGLNVSFYHAKLPNECGTSLQNYCDDTLVHFTSAKLLEETSLRFRIEGFAHSDFDLRVYTSDATGTQGDYLGNPKGDSAGLVPLATFNGDPETATTAADPDSYYLVRVVYFMAPGHEAYQANVSWTGTFAPEDPPVVG